MCHNHGHVEMSSAVVILHRQHDDEDRRIDEADPDDRPWADDH